MSEKWWIDSEDGRLAVENVQDHPEALQVMAEQGRKKLREMELKVLGVSIKEASKDREMLVYRAELEGARLMLNSFIELLTKSKDKHKSRKDED